MKQADLLKRIDELERRVRDLEARPVYVPVPYYPLQPTTPIGPLPYRAPWEQPWYVTCGSTTTALTVGTTVPS